MEFLSIIPSEMNHELFFFKFKSSAISELLSMIAEWIKCVFNLLKNVWRRSPSRESHDWV